MPPRTECFRPSPRSQLNAPVRSQNSKLTFCRSNSGMRALTVDDELVAEVRALVMVEVGAERQRLPPPDGIGPGGRRRDRDDAVILQLRQAEAIVGIDDRIRRVLAHVFEHVEADVDPEPEALRSLEPARGIVEVGAREDRNLAAEADLPGEAVPWLDRKLQFGNPRRKGEGNLRRARLGNQRIEVVAIAKPVVAPLAGDGCGLHAPGRGADGDRAIG